MSASALLAVGTLRFAYPTILRFFLDALVLFARRVFAAAVMKTPLATVRASD